jgi:hypothetical protein
MTVNEFYFFPIKFKSMFRVFLFGFDALVLKTSLSAGYG